MGLFGSSKKTRVGTSVMRVLEDRHLPDSNTSGLLRAIFEGGSVPRYVMQEYVNNIGVRAERMYAYAKRGSYTYGLPSGETTKSAAAVNEVETVLAQIEGRPVSVAYSQFGLPNLTHSAWLEIVRRYNWHGETNELRTLSTAHGAMTWLIDFQILLPVGTKAEYDSLSLAQWGLAPSTGKKEDSRLQDYMDNLGYTPPQTSGPVKELVRHTPIIESAAVSVPTVRMHHRHRQNGHFFGRHINGSVDFPLPEYPEEEDYFQVEYRIGDERKFWSYNPNEAKHPILDNLFEVDSGVSGDFFPFIYMRYGKRSMATDKGSQGYITSKRMCKYLGLGYDDLIEGVHENPDIDDIEQAMVILAAQANTKDPDEARYVYDYFDRLRLRQEITNHHSGLQDAMITGFNTGLTGPKYAQVIQDKRFKMTLGHEGIFKRRVGGKIGPKGTHTTTYTTRRVDKNWGEDGLDVPTINRNHIFRKQVTDTMYDELHVSALGMRYHIYGRYSELGDNTEEHLLIPIDRTVTQNYNIATREKLYAKSLHYVFNSRVVIKVKWYQSGFFSFVMQVAGIALALYTGGQSLLATSAALTAGTLAITQVVLSMVIGVIKSIIFSFAFQLFVEMVGPEIGMLLAVVALAASIYQIHTGDGSLKDAPWAEELLEASSGLTKGVSTHYSKALEGIYEEMEDLRMESERLEEELETARDLLHTDTHLSPIMFIGERPSDYFRRTMHAGSISKYAIKSISTYVPRSLRLPTIADTLGGNFNHVV